VTLYVVFRTLFVTCCSTADIAALLFPRQWHTSGKLLYAKKSDLPETAIR